MGMPQDRTVHLGCRYGYGYGAVSTDARLCFCCSCCFAFDYAFDWVLCVNLLHRKTKRETTAWRKQEPNIIEPNKTIIELQSNARARGLGPAGQRIRLTCTRRSCCPCVIMLKRMRPDSHEAWCIFLWKMLEFLCSCVLSPLERQTFLGGIIFVCTSLSLFSNNLLPNLSHASYRVR